MPDRRLAVSLFRAGFSCLLAGAVLLVVVPVSYGLISAPPTDTPVIWCGTWLFRRESFECIDCCDRFGAYETRGELSGWILLVGLLVLVASLVAQARSARSSPAADESKP